MVLLNSTFIRTPFQAYCQLLRPDPTSTNRPQLGYLPGLRLFYGHSCQQKVSVMHLSEIRNIAAPLLLDVRKLLTTSLVLSKIECRLEQFQRLINAAAKSFTTKYDCSACTSPANVKGINMRTGYSYRLSIFGSFEEVFRTVDTCLSFGDFVNTFVTRIYWWNKSRVSNTSWSSYSTGYAKNIQKCPRAVTPVFHAFLSLCLPH